MSFLTALPIIGKVFEKAGDIIDQAVTDKDLAGKLKHEIEKQMLSLDYSSLEKEMEARARIITSETEGQGFLQRNWRPILMLTFTYIIAHNYIIAPILRMFFPEMISLELPPDMWGLLKLGIGGYIVGRSGEKIVKSLKKGK